MNIQDRLIQDGTDEEHAIMFYGQRNLHGWLSNFSPHPITLHHPFTGIPTVYRTTEHRYQAMKATNAKDHDYVNAVDRPSYTKDRGRSILLRPEWGDDYYDYCWFVMYECLVAKVTQHPALRVALNRFRDNGMFLYEDSPTDDIWGVRYSRDYRGKNLLGRCWMQVWRTT